MTGRRRLFAGLIGTVIVSAAVGWVASSQIRSPAEIAARTAPPPASAILVPAEQRILSTDIVTRGTVRFGSPQQLYLAPSFLKPDVGVVNRLPPAGTQLHEGDVVFTTSGRPVFLLQGVQPAFRDLGPGINGDDVRQLEEALGRMGFDPGKADGVYDKRTEAAVTAWYRKAGFSAFTASTAQLAAIRTLETERNSSQLDVIGAQGSVAVAQAAVEAAKRAQARARLATGAGLPTLAFATARAAADNAVAAADVAARQAILAALQTPPSVVPPTPAQISAAEADLVIAQSNADLTRTTGEQAVASAIANGTPAEIAAAQAQAEAANRVSAAEVAARQAALDGLRGGTPGTPPTRAELATAEADLATARANAESTRLAGERLVAEAQAADTISHADRTSSLANSTGDVRAAERALGYAYAALNVRHRQTQLVGRDLGLARLRAGIQVPADEVIVVASPAVRVSELVVASGARATGPLMKVTDATVAVDGSLRLEEAPLVAPGMRVLIDEPDLGIKATGKVLRVADSPGSNGVDGFHVYFEVLVDDAPASLVGASVRMKVPIESTGGSVLAVPISALSLSADGSSRVQRDHNGTLEFVTVEPGLSADGLVAVKPLGGSLAAGDLVVIGFDQPGAALPVDQATAPPVDQGSAPPAGQGSAPPGQQGSAAPGPQTTTSP